MEGREPNMVLVEAVRGGRPRLAVEKTLVIYERPGVYTEEVRSLYG
jgi:tRNA1Val (adenine37-N6)-methyltransferase